MIRKKPSCIFGSKCPLFFNLSKDCITPPNLQNDFEGVRLCLLASIYVRIASSMCLVCARAVRWHANINRKMRKKKSQDLLTKIQVFSTILILSKIESPRWIWIVFFCFSRFLSFSSLFTFSLCHFNFTQKIADFSHPFDNFRYICGLFSALLSEFNSPRKFPGHVTESDRT